MKLHRHGVRQQGWSIAVMLAVVAAGAGYWYFNRARVEVAVNTVPVTRGDIIDTVGATGTVHEIETIPGPGQRSQRIDLAGYLFGDHRQ